MKTYAAAAADLGVSKQTIQRLAAAHAFAVVRINARTVRIADAEWDRFKARRTRRAS